jgi:hypothetical protein
MPVDFAWHDPEQRVMRYSLTGDWDWNQFHRTLRRSTLRFDETSGPVSVVIDFRGSSRLPAGAIGHLRSALNSLAHPHFSGRGVLIGIESPVQAALGVRDGALRTAGGMIHFAPDEETAHAILNR